MEKKIQDVGMRALKTFVQAFVSSIVANIALFSSVSDWDGFKAVLVSVGIPALSAGISAAWNAISNYLDARGDE